MDKGVLSDKEVVAASRDFICARLLTYESAEEGKFLKALFTGRTGELENTVFALLGSDGETRLSRTGRSPEMAFGDTKSFVEALRKITKDQPAATKVARAVPYLVDLRRALDTAACDLQPLVIVAAATAERRAKLEETLAPLAWTPEFIGRFAYAPVTKLEDLSVVEGLTAREGIFVVEPDAFGVKGKLLAEGADARKTLATALEKFKPVEKDSKAQIAEAGRKGIRWKTEIPETDPGPPGK